MRIEFKKVGRTKGAALSVADDAAEASLPVEAMAQPTIPEHWLLKLFFMHEETIEWIHAHLDLNWLQHPYVREIISLRLAAQTNNEWQGVAAFLTQCESVQMRTLITEITAEDRPIPNPTQQLGDILLRLRNQYLDRQPSMLTQRASRPELDDAGRLEVLHEQQALRQLKRQPLAPLASHADEPF